MKRKLPMAQVHAPTVDSISVAWKDLEIDASSPSPTSRVGGTVGFPLICSGAGIVSLVSNLTIEDSIEQPAA